VLENFALWCSALRALHPKIHLSLLERYVVMLPRNLLILQHIRKTRLLCYPVMFPQLLFYHLPNPLHIVSSGTNTDHLRQYPHAWKAYETT